MKIFFCCLIAAFMINFNDLIAKPIKFQNLKADKSTEYVFRLLNGDILSGTVSELFRDNKGLAARLNTIIGTTVLYEDEIIEIRTRDDYYRHAHRVFLLPTAIGIGDDHFIGNFELGLFYLGFGIGEFISFNAGRSILPFDLPHQQFSTGGVKASFHTLTLEDIPADIYLGFGGNLAFLNDNNRLIHYYANATYLGDKSSVTAVIFYKAGSQDYALISFKSEFVDMIYPNGSFGIGLGLDTKFSHRNDLRFIGEIWNSDINRPSSSLIMLGLRLAGTKFSSDFGLAFFMEPYAVPFVSFVWTPF